MQAVALELLLELAQVSPRLLFNLELWYLLLPPIPYY